MSWTFNNSNSNSESTSDTSITVSVSVTAGDLVVVHCKWEGSDTTITGDIGGEALTEWAPASNTHIRSANEPWGTILYKIGTALSGSQTVTLNWGAARGFKDIEAMSYTPSAGTVTKHGTEVRAEGASTSPASGNMTITSTDFVAFGCNNGYGNVSSNELINAVAADQVIRAPASGANTRSALWARALTSGFTGQAACTIASARWGCGIIAFDLAAAGGAATPRLTLLGVG